jgi:hypothetical protein
MDARALIAERGVLLLLGIGGVGGPIAEVLLHGPVQGCLIAFAGIGFGCGR